MIKLEIDVSTCSKKHLYETAKYLFAMSGNELVAVPADVNDLKQEVVSTPSAPKQEVVPTPSKPEMFTKEELKEAIELKAPPVPPKETPPPASSVFGKGSQSPVSEPVANQTPDAPEEKKDEPVAIPPGVRPTGEVELDAEGLPWDNRIHARTKMKMKNTGIWKKKRGVDPKVYESVVAELKSVMALPKPAFVPAPPPLVSNLKQPKPYKPENAQDLPDFQTLMNHVTRSLASREIEQKDIVEVCQEYDIPALPLLANRKDLIPGVIRSLKARVRKEFAA